MKRKVFLKIVFALVLIFIVSILQRAITPMVTNDIALNQLENSDAAFTEYQTWKQLLNYTWLLYILPVLLFVPELATVAKGTKKKTD